MADFNLNGRDAADYAILMDGFGPGASDSEDGTELMIDVHDSAAEVNMDNLAKNLSFIHSHACCVEHCLTSS